MLWVNSLLSPINIESGKDVRIHNIKLKNSLCQIPEETMVIVRMVSEEPTKVLLLVPNEPDVIIFMNISLEGIEDVIYCVKNYICY